MDQWKSQIYEFPKNLFTTSLLLLGSEILYRVLSIIKEMLLYYRHYSNKQKYWLIISNGFSFNGKTKNVLFILIIFYATMLAVHIENIFILFDTKYFVSFVPTYLLFRYIKFNENHIDVAEWIRTGSGLDYATGMASNYFHGYLNLQLPEKGDGIKGIRHRIEDYEDSDSVKFAIKRLFILVPDSLHCKPKLESNILEKAKPLECVVKDRAGVKRPFRNDVYKFTVPINGEIYYISVEGATPLQSFWESMKFDITSTPIMKAMDREILLQFYKSVKKFTFENPGTRKECEIVYYNDNNDQTDVGYVLKHHIEQMLRDGQS